MAALMKLACALMLCMLLAAPVANAITCGQVAGYVTPCLGYLKSTGGTVPGQCCTGIKNLNGAARSTPDRQAACKCLQSAAKNIPGLNHNLAAGLPGKCGVSIPYPISASTNCNNVK